MCEVDPHAIQVWAKGTISGGVNLGHPACTGVPESDTRKCTDLIWYASVAQSLNAFGAQIVTG